MTVTPLNHAITGLTSGAMTGVVNRLERVGYLRREPDPDDGRRQLLSPVPEKLGEVGELFQAIGRSAESLLDGFDEHQLTAIAAFLDRSTLFARERAAALRAEVLSAGGRSRLTSRKEDR